MSANSKSVANRVSAFVNAGVIVIVLLGVFAEVNRSRMPNGFGDFLAMRITIKSLMLVTFLFAACSATFMAVGLSRPSWSTPFRVDMMRVAKGWTVAALLVWVFPLTSSSGSFSPRIVFYFLPAALIACLGSRVAARVCGARLARNLDAHRNFIIVGSGPRASELYERVLAPASRYSRVLGFVDSPNGHAVPGAIREQLLGSLHELDGILIKQPVDEVLIALPAKSCYNDIQTALKTCERVGVEAKYLFDIFDFSRVRLNSPAGGVPVVSLGLAQGDYRLLIKRLLDIGGAILGLVILGPLMMAIAAVIKATSRGPAMYRQERCGWHQRRFYIYKFRTMVPDADHVLAVHLEQNRALKREWESDHKLRDDPRVTRIGRLLRKTSLDELPQLLNVLRGEMSLVGPRPIVDSEVPRYGESFALYRQVIPGLTGLWQVSGRNDRSYQERVDLDSHYIRNWSLKYDSYILLRTVKVLVTRYGAY